MKKDNFPNFALLFMETYSSNIDSSVLQDLGPFKIMNADNSIKGKFIYSYSTSQEQTLVSIINKIGERTIHGNSIKIRLK